MAEVHGRCDERFTGVREALAQQFDGAPRTRDPEAVSVRTVTGPRSGAYGRAVHDALG